MNFKKYIYNVQKIKKELTIRGDKNMVVIKDDTNIVNLTGELEDNLEFSHEIFGEKFFNTKIKINRKKRGKIENFIFPLSFLETCKK